ncbi:putative 3-hydroxyphenylpropionic transporter MhpT [Roseovarius albus]|uniref:Putative 3-hydroxyphenylpropionic transporter MhpT n=1 Tax=Roseovarius albus TaxID=1247867 RepID=A0A1X6Z4G6_9RHOB|nr:MFS transporter [Roseovarius albus]SLN40541.1 putative 3-hydroxyphenylpropionic transporter MhpT [Roseovarius albus]
MAVFDFIRENLRWLSAGMLLTFVSSFGQTFFISIFAGEIQAAFELSHGQWGGIYSLGTTASAILMIWAGGLTDIFRVRILGPIILVLLALACLSMAFSAQWWMLPFVIFALRFTGQGMSSHIAVVAMGRWFVATRGTALSIATLGFAIGEAVLPIIFVALMTLYDWRILWGVAACIAILGIPVLMRLLAQERTPQSVAQASQSFGMENRHWTRNQVLTHRLFWFMVPALLGPSAFVTAFFFHQVHFAAVKGIEHIQFVKMFPFYTLTGICAMIISGRALDILGTARLIPFFQLPMALSFVLFAWADSTAMMYIAFFFFALTVGANTTLPNAFWAEFYGTAHLGSIKAMAAAVMVLGSAIGPGVTGLGLDYGVNINLQFLFIAVFFVLATLSMWFGISTSKRALPIPA